MFRQLAPLFKAHYDEAEPFNSTAPFDPDFELLFALERQGKLRFFTAQREGVILGLAMYVIATTFWRKSVLTAVRHLLFVRPSERGGWLAMKLLRGSEAALVHNRVGFIRDNPPANVALLLVRLGYVKTHSGDYEKKLG